MTGPAQPSLVCLQIQDTAVTLYPNLSSEEFSASLVEHNSKHLLQWFPQTVPVKKISRKKTKKVIINENLKTKQKNQKTKRTVSMSSSTILVRASLGGGG